MAFLAMGFEALPENILNRNMIHTFFSTAVGRLKLLGWLEGSSLLLLVGLAVPLKYICDAPAFVKILGPIHGILFLLFIFQAISAGIEQRWSFRKTTWKVLVACLIPFGTFYVNARLLKLNTQSS
jgi:integral membrane protein